MEHKSDVEEAGQKWKQTDNGTLKGGRPSLCTLCLSSLNPQSNPMR